MFTTARAGVCYLESADLPEGVRVLDIHTQVDIDLRPRTDSQHLGERVAVLEGQAERIQQDEWLRQLYRNLQDPGPEKIDLCLIPYYAWGNRTGAEMPIWVPLLR